MTYKEAKEQTVFVYNHKGEIEKTTYAEHVLASLDECTHSSGVIPKLGTKEIIKQGYVCVSDPLRIISMDDFNLLEESEQGEYDYDPEAITVHAVVTYRSNVRGYSVVAEFETEEEADNDFFERVEKYEFARDDQRNTEYFYTLEEISRDRVERFAEKHEIDFTVAESVLKKWDFLKSKGRL